MENERFYIDPQKIAEELGIEVKPYQDVPYHISSDLCGHIEKKDGKLVIYYNPTHHEHRQRFTIAHELAHYLLGHLDNKDRLERDTSKNFTLDNYDPIEAEANKLAAQILMPEDKIKFLIFNKNITDVREIAKLLRVSPAAMSYRLEKLGYL
jgi:Zn-dependent peptidase ImmA (M78 family)